MDGVSAGAEGGAPAEVPAGIAAKTPYRGSITYHPSGQRELVKLYSRCTNKRAGGSDWMPR